MSLKWKIFRVINYLHVAGACILAIVWGYNLDKSFSSGKMHDSILTAAIIIIIIGCISMIVNSCINIYLLEKCYPDKNVKKSIYNWQTAAGIFVFLMLLLMAAGVGVSLTRIYRLYKIKQYSADTWTSIYLTLMISTILTGLFLIFMQIGLRRIIRRNFRKNLENFLQLPE